MSDRNPSTEFAPAKKGALDPGAEATKLRGVGLP